MHVRGRAERYIRLCSLRIGAPLTHDVERLLSEIATVSFGSTVAIGIRQTAATSCQ
jgi:hypothetical protein